MASTFVNPPRGGTMVNQYGRNGVSTDINPPVSAGIASSTSLDLEPGAILPDDYSVIRRIGNAADSGEADVFLCEKDGRQFAAKVFRREMHIKPELIDKLSSISSEHVARMHYHGEVYGRHFEVYDYFWRGSLADTLKERTFSERELREYVIPNLNTALHALHVQGILHRDIKPSNIMWSNDEKWKLVLIDFGLSSVIRESLSVVVSQVGFTTAYAAPEVLRNLYFDESDYFSMGIVLYELFCGTTPFANQDNALTSIITKPGNMPQDIYNLILGLTYPELTHRGDVTNPNRRWTYDEVNSWLQGENVPVPGDGGFGSGSARSISPIRFCNVNYNNIDELCYAMAVNWEEGKKLLLRMTLRDHLRSRRGASDEHLLWASIIDDNVGSARYDEDEKLMRTLYDISPDAAFIFTPIGVFPDAKAFGSVLFDRLSSKSADVNEDAAHTADLLLKTKALSNFVEKYPTPGVTAEQIREFEQRRQLQNWPRQRYGHLFELAYRLSQRNDLNVGLPDGTVFRSMDELKTYLAKLGTGDFRELYNACGYLLDGEHQMKPKVYGWIRSLGFQAENFNI